MTAPSTGDPATIEIEVLGRHIRGTLRSSTIAASFADQLPLTLHFEDYGQQEKIATLPTALNTAGAPSASSAAVATIAYYAPAQALVLYYENVGRYPGIMPIGAVDEIATLRALTTGFTATIRLRT